MGKVQAVGQQGRRPGRKVNSVPIARSAFNAAFAQRIRAGRARLSERLGYTVTQREMAQRLSRLAGYAVSTDNYRKYERSRKPVLMPHDLCFYFAELTDMTVGALLVPIEKRQIPLTQFPVPIPGALARVSRKTHR